MKKKKFDEIDILLIIIGILISIICIFTTICCAAIMGDSILGILITIMFAGMTITACGGIWYLILI